MPELFQISAFENADNMAYEAFGVPLMEFKLDLERFEDGKSLLWIYSTNPWNEDENGTYTW